MSEKNATVCDLTDELPHMTVFPDFHKNVMCSKTKQQMIEACVDFISFHGGFSNAGEVRRKLLGT